MFARITTACAIALSVLTGAVASAAQPTPVPGGANQLSAVETSITAPHAFNGEIRLRKMKLERRAYQGKSFVVFTALVSNGTKNKMYGGLPCVLADIDGITLPTAFHQEWIPSTVPGASQRMEAWYDVPGDFKIAKVLVSPALPYFKNRPFRISVPAGAVPEASASTPQ